MIGGVAGVGYVPAAQLPQPGAAPSTGDAAFSSRLEEAVGGVNASLQSGDDALRALASGGDVDLHGSMIALEHADIALRAMVAVRDKVVGAYEQLMNLAI
jgi:flagellar hook-basal body complex protein FliE